MVVIALGIGGYFLATGNSKKDPVTPAATSVQSLISTGGATPGSSGSPAAPPTGSSGGAFTPPSSYASNSLEEDPGCGDYAGGAADFLSDYDSMTSTAAATTEFTSLAGEVKSGAGDAQNSTLAAALDAEAAYIQKNEPALAAGMAAYTNSEDADDSQFGNAFQGIASTDEYINGVCGLDSWSPTEP